MLFENDKLSLFYTQVLQLVNLRFIKGLQNLTIYKYSDSLFLKLFIFNAVIFSLINLKLLVIKNYTEFVIFLAFYRKSQPEKPSILSENERELLRFHSASVERAIPGYAGHRKIQPEIYSNSITRSDNHYGPRFVDKSPIHSHSTFRVKVLYRIYIIDFKF